VKISRGLKNLKKYLNITKAQKGIFKKIAFFCENEKFSQKSLKNLQECGEVFNFASSKQMSGAMLGSKCTTIALKTTM
jgi:hypothetical protein